MPALLEIQCLCHKASKDAGWWNEAYLLFADLDLYEKFLPHIITTKICLIHSELSEGMEGFRKNLKDSHLSHRSSLEVELADAVIRILYLAGFFNFDLEETILEKLEYNRNRSDHKIENRAAPGGKTF